MRAIAWMLGVLLLLGLAGCATDPSEGADHRPAMQIELLGFHGCPHMPALRENLSTAAGAEGLKFTEIDLLSLPESDPRRGWPAPTVLIDGADLLGMERPVGGFPGCRVFAGGVPTPEVIRERLGAMRSRR